MKNGYHIRRRRNSHEKCNIKIKNSFNQFMFCGFNDENLLFPKSGKLQFIKHSMENTGLAIGLIKLQVKMGEILQHDS